MQAERVFCVMPWLGEVLRCWASSWVGAQLDTRCLIDAIVRGEERTKRR